MKNFLTFLILLTFFSCDDDNDEQVNNDFYVTVAGTSMDCGLTLIDFLPVDSTRIYQLTNYHGWLRYHAFELDSTLNDVGSTLNVTIRTSQDDELFACTTMGPAYPWVTILTAEKVN